MAKAMNIQEAVNSAATHTAGFFVWFFLGGGELNSLSLSLSLSIYIYIHTHKITVTEQDSIL